MASFNNTAPPGRSYRDHLYVHFREFVAEVGGGSKLVRCHPSLSFMFNYIDIEPTVDATMLRDTATVGDTRIQVENL